MPSLARPASLDEALEVLRADRVAQPIAGGVGLLLRAALGEPLPERVVAIGRLPELRAIDAAGTGVRIGAAVTLAELARSALVRERAPLLAEAAGAAANPGVRTTATLGGNLLDRPGGSDLAAAALALDAEAVEAPATSGRERRPLRAMLEAEPNHPTAAPRPLLVAIVIPPAGDWGFERLTTRGAGDRPTATVAVALAAPRDRSSAAAWATSIGDRPVPLSNAARAILDEATSEAVGDALDRDLDAVAVADDLRATAAYRRRVLPVLLRRAITAARDRR